jgi:membrane peptidoglycan carboxypeptidase
MGYTPDLVVGVFVGFRQSQADGPRSDRRPGRGPDLQGLREEGAGRRPPVPIPGAEGPEADRNQPATGMQDAGRIAGTILEAFKPGTGPAGQLFGDRLPGHDGRSDRRVARSRGRGLQRHQRPLLRPLPARAVSALQVPRHAGNVPRQFTARFLTRERADSSKTRARYPMRAETAKRSSTKSSRP